jgi:Arc/MetJ family transcription regulator
MTTQLSIDNQLLQKAFRVSGLKMPKDAVTAALEEYIQKRKTEDVITLFHSVDFDAEYDYKNLRNRK